jgi:phage terminase large subunit GpA-like protein
MPIIHSAADAFRPPRRVDVATGAAEHLRIVQPGGYTGPWSAAETPYMVEPMNTLASRRHEALIFVGPARGGKTMGLLDGWLTYAATCDPGDMLIAQMTQDKARDYSRLRVDRAIRHSPGLKALMSPRGHDDNTHDKLFRHGMAVKIGWPSASQFASSDYRYTAGTDYDRWPDNIDGEGSGYSLLLKRTTTFLSRGMCMIESSPGKPVTDPGWKASTPHEAPPAHGILGLYNRGDRRQFYWPCPHCRDLIRVEPGLGLFASLPDDDDLLEVVRGADLSALATEHAVVFCPHCGSAIEAKHKHGMNVAGAWLRDGQSSPDADDGIHSSVASFWLGGAAAAYQSWNGIILRHLQALRSYAASNEEESLRATANTDQAIPYLPRALRNQQKHGDISDHAEDFPRFIVPSESRFITVAVDVQGGQDSRFEIQAHAHAPDHEQWIIDRRPIRDSKRPGSRDSGFAQVDPARYPEDWDVLTDLLNSTYRTSDEGQELRVAEIIVDTGGEEGVTENAYAWWRGLPPDFRRRVWLYKGASTKNAAPLKESRVGGSKKHRAVDVPLLLCNPNPLKDAVFNGIRREDSGSGKVHIGSWVGAAFWDELRAEIRMPDGTYKQVRSRNEALDLSAMTRALIMHMETRRMGRLNWENPPPWARELPLNSNRMTRDERRAEQKPRPKPRRASNGLGGDDWVL